LSDSLQGWNWSATMIRKQGPDLEDRWPLSQFDPTLHNPTLPRLRLADRLQISDDSC